GGGGGRGGGAAGGRSGGRRPRRRPGSQGPPRGPPTTGRAPAATTAARATGPEYRKRSSDAPADSSRCASATRRPVSDVDALPLNCAHTGMPVPAIARTVSDDDDAVSTLTRSAPASLTRWTAARTATSVPA